jgi:hypothetical protein
VDAAVVVLFVFPQEDQYLKRTSRSFFSRHAEVMIQRTRLECATAEGIEPDAKRGLALLNRRDMGQDDAFDLMLHHSRRNDVRAWTAAYSAFVLMLGEEEFSDFSILDAVFSRTANRLVDRLIDSAKKAAADPGDVSEEMSAFGAAMIGKTVDVLADFRESVGYEPPASATSAAWETRHRLQLGPSSGVQDERDAYLSADLTSLERRVIERIYAKRFPHLGCIHAIAAISSDVYSRYGRGSEQDMERAVRSAEEVFRFTLSLIEPPRR